MATPESLYLVQLEAREHRNILLSPKVGAFLATVTPGQRIAFFDMDQTLTQAGVDTEDRAYKLGLVPSYTEELDLVDDRFEILRRFTPRVTPELSAHTLFPEGITTNAEVVRGLGRSLGGHLLEEGAFRPEALDVLQACAQKDMRLVVLTATPDDIAIGIMDSVSQHLGVHIYVLGRELEYDNQGKVTPALFMYGKPKKEVVLASKALGADASLGAGDKAYVEGSDEFVLHCEIQVALDNRSPEECYQKWQNVLRMLKGIN